MQSSCSIGLMIQQTNGNAQWHPTAIATMHQVCVGPNSDLFSKELNMSDSFLCFVFVIQRVNCFFFFVFLAEIVHAATSSSAADESEIDGYQETPQIIFCSRTHSQLTQFVNEIKRTPFADGLRCVSLGSRKNLCVHPVV